MLCKLRVLMLSLGALALGACAGEPAAPVTAMRVIVQLVQPSTDGAAIAAQVSASSARTARYLAATSERWHALSVACSDADDCDAVLQRLRADTAHFETVQRDQRKRFVSP